MASTLRPRILTVMLSPMLEAESLGSFDIEGDERWSGIVLRPPFALDHLGSLRAASRHRSGRDRRRRRLLCRRDPGAVVARLPDVLVRDEGAARARRIVLSGRREEQRDLRPLDGRARRADDRAEESRAATGRCRRSRRSASPMRCPWGEKALTGYLGADRAAWREYDATALIEERGWRGPPLLVDQGTSDRSSKASSSRSCCAGVRARRRGARAAPAATATTTAISSSRRSSRITCGSTPATWASRRTDFPRQCWESLAGHAMRSRCIFRYTALRLTPRLRATWLMLPRSCSSSRSSAARSALPSAFSACGRGRRFGLGGSRAQAVVRRQIGDVEPVARAQRDHGAQRVAQLPQVAGPAMRAQRVDQPLAERDRRRVGRLLGEHVADERALVGALAKPRQRQGEPLQPVEQVLAKLLAADPRLEARGARRDEPHVVQRGVLAGSAGGLALLEDMQQARLQRAGQLADVVEEQGAAAGLRQRALRAGARRARRSSRRRTARRRARSRVQRAGEELLAGPGLAHQKDRQRARGDALRGAGCCAP